MSARVCFVFYLDTPERPNKRGEYTPDARPSLCLWRHPDGRWGCIACASHTTPLGNYTPVSSLGPVRTTHTEFWSRFFSLCSAVVLSREPAPAVHSLSIKTRGRGTHFSLSSHHPLFFLRQLRGCFKLKRGWSAQHETRKNRAESFENLFCLSHICTFSLFC
jgi:hypothetical protein